MSDPNVELSPRAKGASVAPPPPGLARPYLIPNPANLPQQLPPAQPFPPTNYHHHEPQLRASSMPHLREYPTMNYAPMSMSSYIYPPMGMPLTNQTVPPPYHYFGWHPYPTRVVDHAAPTNDSSGKILPCTIPAVAGAPVASNSTAASAPSVQPPAVVMASPHAQPSSYPQPFPRSQPPPIKSNSVSTIQLPVKGRPKRARTSSAPQPHTKRPRALRTSKTETYQFITEDAELSSLQPLLTPRASIEEAANTIGRALAQQGPVYNNSTPATTVSAAEEETLRLDLVTLIKEELEFKKTTLAPNPPPTTGRRVLTAEQKRNHNIIERKYRQNINAKIAGFQQSIPWLSSKEPSFYVKEKAGTPRYAGNNSLNKSEILDIATEYILHLQARDTHLTRENHKLQSLINGLK